MRVGQWMTKEPITVGSGESIVTARTLMDQHGVRRLPVVEHDRLVGIVTDGDLREAWPSVANALTAHELQYLLGRTPVRSIMTASVVAVTPATPLTVALRALEERRVGGLPVLRGNRLVGILTKADVFGGMHRNCRPGPEHLRALSWCPFPFPLLRKAPSERPAGWRPGLRCASGSF